MLSTDPIDWLRDENGDLVVPMQHATGSTAVAQNMQLRLRLFREEWFLNQEIGPPWLPGEIVTEQQAILGQRFDVLKTRAGVVNALAGTPGLGSLTDIIIDFDPRTRGVSITVHAVTIFGDTIRETIQVTP